MPEGLYRNLFTAWLGFPGPGFSSTDYFSLVPWLFLFLAGYFLRRLLDRPLERLDPDALRCPPLCALGRWSLPVYMLHQPVVYGVLLAGAALAGKVTAPSAGMGMAHPPFSAFRAEKAIRQKYTYFS